MADHPRIPVGPPGLGDSGVEWRSYVLSAGNKEEREGLRRSSGDWADKANRLLHLQFSLGRGRRKEGAMKFMLERGPCGQGNILLGSKWRGQSVETNLMSTAMLPGYGWNSWLQVDTPVRHLQQIGSTLP